MITYEEKLNRDLDWALREGSLHFEECNAVHRSLRRITRLLTAWGVPYAVIGALALYFHGYRRFSEDLDILLTPEGLERLGGELGGNGYVLTSLDGRQWRDADSGVRIDFFITGEFPGDRRPKPLTFPDPSKAGTELGGITVVRLAVLIELKLASGMTNVRRLRDLADAQELIAQLRLDADFADQLHPFVREKYLELLKGVTDGCPDI